MVREISYIAFAVITAALVGSVLLAFFSTRKIKVRAVLGILTFLSIWLVPIAYAAVNKFPHQIFQHEFRYTQNISCLFSDTVNSWVNQVIWIRHKGDKKWQLYPTVGIADMHTFGKRSRLLRLFSHLQSKDAQAKRTAFLEIAQWLVEKYQQRYPDRPEITEIRVIAYVYNTRVKNLDNGTWPPNRKFDSQYTVASFKKEELTHGS